VFPEAVQRVERAGLHLHAADRLIARRIDVRSEAPDFSPLVSPALAVYSATPIFIPPPSLTSRRRTSPSVQGAGCSTLAPFKYLRARATMLVWSG